MWFTEAPRYATDWRVPTLSIKATGRGSYCRTRLDRFGFPRGYLTRSKTAFGFATGDLVVADVPKGKHAGRHVGRVAIRASGSFNVSTPAGVAQGISYRHYRVVQRGDGYAGSRPPTLETQNEERRAFRPDSKDRAESAKKR